MLPGGGRVGSAVWLLMCDLPLCPWGWESVHGRPAWVRGRLWGVCGKRRCCRFGAWGDGSLARVRHSGVFCRPADGGSGGSGRWGRRWDDGGDGGVERVWPGSWARQGRRVITTADCLSLLGLDHTDGGPEVKRRTERPLPEATHSRQVASGCPALGAYAHGTRAIGRADGRADGAGRAVTRLTGPDGLRPTPLLSSVVLPAPGPGGPRGREPGRTPTASSSHAGALSPARPAARRCAGLHR